MTYRQLFNAIERMRTLEVELWEQEEKGRKSCLSNEEKDEIEAKINSINAEFDEEIKHE